MTHGFLFFFLLLFFDWEPRVGIYHSLRHNHSETVVEHRIMNRVLVTFNFRTPKKDWVGANLWPVALCDDQAEPPKNMVSLDSFVAGDEPKMFCVVLNRHPVKKSV